MAGRLQVSGADVILAHRLLKNSIESNEYLLLTESAFRIMGGHLQGRFETYQETYEGFDRVAIKVRVLEKELLRARDAVYRMSEEEREAAVDDYLGWIRRYLRSAVVGQMRSPIRRFSWRERLLMMLEAFSLRFRLNGVEMRRSIMATQAKRGHRRHEWEPAEKVSP